MAVSSQQEETGEGERQHQLFQQLGTTSHACPSRQMRELHAPTTPPPAKTPAIPLGIADAIESGMEIRCSPQTNRAMTLVEAVVVILITGALIMLLLPSFSHSCNKCQKISCSNNLKQLGLAMKIWAGDNDNKPPMEVSATNGGSMELMDTPDAWKTFQVMSNELSTPKVIFCPEDSTHSGYATNWGDDLKHKISYFINVDANDTNATMLVSGDDNFRLNQTSIPPGRFDVAATAPLEWDRSRHLIQTNYAWFFPAKFNSGNLLLGDGSVQMTSNSTLTNYLTQTGLATNRLFIP
jgi:competence protein ComGC